jgi:hypothetical protein
MCEAVKCLKYDTAWWLIHGAIKSLSKLCETHDDLSTGAVNLLIHKYLSSVGHMCV